MSIDDFLGHKPSAGGSSSRYLRGWKKRNPPQIDVWLHTACVPQPLWQHNVPRIYERDKADSFPQTEKEKVVYGSSWNCWEDESVLKKQRFIDRNTGQRAEMPRICPVCRLIENIRQKYDDENAIEFCEQLFQWTADDPSKGQSLSVGGILSRYGRDDLTSEEKKAMGSAGVDPRKAWRETLWAKCNYVFVVVEEGAAEDGVQIAIETTQVGQVVREMIEAQREALGLDQGDPLQNPYAIRFKYNANADLSKKYSALAMPKIALTEDVGRLIRGDVPDLGSTTRPGDVAALRANLEAAASKAAMSLDWDWIFGPAEKEAPQKAAEQVPAESVAEPAQPSQQSNGGRRRRKKEPEPPAPPPPAVETEPCEECGEPMETTATKCSSCGAEYDIVEVAPAEAPNAGSSDFDF